MRVLLVDDHEYFVEGLRILLDGSRLDLTVVGQAYDGKEAVDLAKIFNPDLIIMDISMPEMDGFEATKKILSDNKDILIIGLSMYPYRKYAQELLNCGARGYVVKTGGFAEIIYAISEVKRGHLYLSRIVTPSKPDEVKNKPN